jgi:murein DD-endopeptidase MepM/ murein hydrolase activator NlpD
MISLAISMAASNLLLIRESNCASAAEPVGDQPRSSMVPPATEAEAKSRKSVEPEAVKALAVATPVKSVVKHTVPEGQTLRQLSQKYQVGVAATYVKKFRRVGEVNDPLKAKQRVALKRFKQKSNRLKEILAELRSEESNNSSAPATESAEFSSNEKAQATLSAAVIVPELPKSAVNKPTVLVPSVWLDYRVKAGDTLSSIARKHDISLQQIVNANKLTAPDWLQINQRLIIPVFRSTHGQQQAASLSPKVAKIDNSAVLDAQKSDNQPSDAVIVPELPKSAVNKPTVLVPSVWLDYRVKAGDTLSLIARKHNISLQQIGNANKLTAPYRLQINQRLTIPAFQDSSAAGQTIAVNNSSVSVPKLSTRSESIRSNRAVASQQESAPVPPTPLAETASLGVPSGIGGSISDETADEQSQLAQPTPAFSGIGGSISDETAAETPPTFDKSQLPQSTAAKPEKLQSNPYFQNLQTDIQRLKQKYYAQQTVSPVVPRMSQTVTLAAQAAETLKPAIQKPRPTQTKSPVLPKARVATAPISVDASESLQSLRGKQVSPDLPPLATVDTYLPKPFETAANFKSFIWPTKGALTSGYGWRWGRMHKGIDIAAPIGTPIVAAAPGVVIKAGWNSGGYGRLVDIQHADGTFTRYAHNNRLLVHAGQQVEQGQQISEMGSTGHSTGPHLHFEVHPEGKGAVNPIAFLKRR